MIIDTKNTSTILDTTVGITKTDEIHILQNLSRYLQFFLIHVFLYQYYSLDMYLRCCGMCTQYFLHRPGRHPAGGDRGVIDPGQIYRETQGSYSGIIANVPIYKSKQGILLNDFPSPVFPYYCWEAAGVNMVKAAFTPDSWMG